MASRHRVMYIGSAAITLMGWVMLIVAVSTMSYPSVSQVGSPQDVDEAANPCSQQQMTSVASSMKFYTMLPALHVMIAFPVLLCCAKNNNGIPPMYNRQKFGCELAAIIVTCVLTGFGAAAVYANTNYSEACCTDILQDCCQVAAIAVDPVTESRYCPVDDDDGSSCPCCFTPSAVQWCDTQVGGFWSVFAVNLITFFLSLSTSILGCCICCEPIPPGIASALASQQGFPVQQPVAGYPPPVFTTVRLPSQPAPDVIVQNPSGDIAMGQSLSFTQAQLPAQKRL